MSKQISLAPGEYLFHEGDNSRELYMLLSGEIEALIEGRVMEVHKEAGSIVGQMSFLLSRPRGASIRVTKPSEFIVFEDPETLIAAQPLVLLRIAQNLAQRFRGLENRVVNQGLLA